MPEKLKPCKHETEKDSGFGLKRPWCAFYLQFLSATTCTGCPANEKSLPMENERERLLKEISWIIGEYDSPKREEIIADFILSDRRKILEEIEKPLLKWQETQQKLVNCQCFICQAISIIAEKKG